MYVCPSVRPSFVIHPSCCACISIGPAAYIGAQIRSDDTKNGIERMVGSGASELEGLGGLETLDGPSFDPATSEVTQKEDKEVAERHEHMESRLRVDDSRDGDTDRDSEQLSLGTQ